MAWAKITRRWADESELEVEVGCEASYPDAVSEIVAAVVRLDSQAAPEDSE
jgi:hypothetical protein